MKTKKNWPPYLVSCNPLNACYLIMLKNYFTALRLITTQSRNKWPIECHLIRACYFHFGQAVWRKNDLRIAVGHIELRYHCLMFFFKQKTAYEIASCLVGSEMCIRDSIQWISTHQVGGPVFLSFHIDIIVKKVKLKITISVFLWAT